MGAVAASPIGPQGVSDHGALTGLLDDDHVIYALLAGRVGGQFLYGGVNAGDVLELQGADNSPDLGQVQVHSPIFMDYDTISNTTPVANYQLTWNPTFSTGNWVGGCLNVAYDATATGAVFIPGTFVDNSVNRTAANPGFAAYTFVNLLATMTNSGNFNVLQALAFNIGLVQQRNSSGTSTTPNATAMNVAFQSRTTAFGAVLTRTNMIGMSMNPTFSTVSGSTVNLGAIRAVSCAQPAVALFQPQAGVENMTSYEGLYFPNMTFGGASAVYSVVRSLLNSGTNKRFLNHTGTAESDHAGNFNLDADFPNGLLRQGLSNDYVQGWVTNEFFQQIITPAVTQWRWSAPSAGRLLLQGAAAILAELNINVSQFSIGASAGAVGNQVGNFVTPARTIGVGGEWADFLLTQGGNLTVNGLAMSRVSAWVINGVSYASSSGSVSNAETLTVGGFPTSSPGVTISERQSLHVIAGRSRFKSVMEYDSRDAAALASGDNDDWGGLLTGTANNGMRHWNRITGNAAGSDVTGIDAGSAQDGDCFKLTNVGADTIRFMHEDAGSSAANRIITPDGNAFLLTPDNSLEIIYDDDDSRWRILTPVPQAGGGGALAGTWQYDDSTTMADPGAGGFRTNNNTPGSVTAIAIADETETGVDGGGLLAALGNGDQLYIFNKEDASEFIVADITANTDNTGWHEFTVTIAGSGNTFTDGKEFAVTLIFA